MVGNANSVLGSAGSRFTRVKGNLFRVESAPSLQRLLQDAREHAAGTAPLALDLVGADIGAGGTVSVSADVELLGPCQLNCRVEVSGSATLRLRNVRIHSTGCPVTASVLSVAGTATVRAAGDCEIVRAVPSINAILTGATVKASGTSSVLQPLGACLLISQSAGMYVPETIDAPSLEVQEEASLRTSGTVVCKLPQATLRNTGGVRVSSNAGDATQFRAANLVTSCCLDVNGDRPVVVESLAVIPNILNLGIETDAKLRMPVSIIDAPSRNIAGEFRIGKINVIPWNEPPLDDSVTICVVGDLNFDRTDEGAAGARSFSFKYGSVLTSSRVYAAFGDPIARGNEVTNIPASAVDALVEKVPPPP